MCDDDLLHVLRYINNMETMARCPETREYLDAGLRILEKQFFAEFDDSGDLEPLTFHWMSRQKILDEVTNGSDGHVGTKGAFDYRWSPLSNYYGDLVLYVLRPCAWGDRIVLADQALEAVDSEKLSVIVKVVTYRHLKLLTESTVMRALFLFTALAGRDSVISDAISKAYSNLGRSWMAVYKNFFLAKGLRLRPGLTLDEFSIMLSGIADGLALRALGDPQASVLDLKRRVSLLGNAVLALAIGCLDAGDGRTVEDAADRLEGSAS